MKNTRAVSKPLPLPSLLSNMLPLHDLECFDFQMYGAYKLINYNKLINPTVIFTHLF